MLQEFKQLVDKTNSNIVAFVDDCIQVAEYLGLDVSMGYSRNAVIDKLDERIKSAIKDHEGVTFMSVKEGADLVDAFIYESVLLDADNSAYLTILKLLHPNQKELLKLEHTEVWGKLLVCCKDYLEFNPGINVVHHDRLRESYPRQYDFAIAAGKLKTMGCDIALEDVTLRIRSGLEDVVAQIESEIAAIGCEVFLKNIFDFLVSKGNYFPIYKRYVIFNELNIIPHLTKPMVPFGFLVNLAVKQHPKPKGKRLTVKEAHQKTNGIISKAVLLGIIIDVRHYGAFEVHFQTNEKLPQFISKLALFDSTFAFPSSNPDDIVESMDHLFRWVDRERFVAKFGFSIEHVIELTKTINSMSAENGPQIIYQSALKKRLPKLSAELPILLEKLSYAVGTANQEYKFLTDYDKLDFGFKPLLKMSETMFMLCDKSWCVAGFYEVLASLVREIDTYQDESNSKIGVSIESYVYHKFEESGINYVHGKYVDGTSSDGEADALVETDKNITLLEIKKKVLTRKAKTGSDKQLVVDLAASLLDAQVQNGRTELLLRNNGFIDLINGDDIVTRVNFSGRSIERIALTQWDYGSFQDRGVINKILSILVDTRLGLVDESDLKMMKAFEKINEKCKIWEGQAIALNKVDPNFDHFPFFNCWFLSLPQLLIILRYCKNNNDFDEVLGSTRHVTMNSSNFYFEFYHHFIRNNTINVV